MHRIDGKNAITDERGRQLFTGGNPHKPEVDEATWLSADWLNSVQEELCGFIESQDIPLAKDNNSGLQKAIATAIEAALGPERERIDKILEELWR
ncbi:MAG: hypothetical protein H6618_06175 [Deltaproteobacteria bacterium]|nr:hypothetical protein [Deltaproteobacteria bacterium]